MGRYSTGAPIAEASVRLSLTYLIREGFVRQGEYSSGSLNWTNGCSVQIFCVCLDGAKYVQLTYGATINGETVKHNHKIKLAAIPSNLGKGEVLYFVCPVSGRLCRYLYLSPQTLKFVSREANPARIYYRSQLSSKLDKSNDRYWAIESILKKLGKERHLLKYSGRKTRYALRIERLLKKRARADKLRWSAISMPMKLRREYQRLIFGKRKV